MSGATHMRNKINKYVCVTHTVSREHLRCPACILIGFKPSSGEVSPDDSLISTSLLISSFLFSADTRGHPDKLYVHVSGITREYKPIETWGRSVLPAMRLKLSGHMT